MLLNKILLYAVTLCASTTKLSAHGLLFLLLLVLFAISRRLPWWTLWTRPICFIVSAPTLLLLLFILLLLLR